MLDASWDTNWGDLQNENLLHPLDVNLPSSSFQYTMKENYSESSPETDN
jgi:hypothetical protein